MFRIQSGVNKPNIELMENRVKEMCKRGIRIGDMRKLSEEFEEVLEDIKQELYTQYGIVNPNSSKEVAAFLANSSESFWVGEKNDIIDVCYSDGKWTSKKEALKTLSAMGYEFADTLLAYRAAHSNVKAVNQLIENADENNLIHPKVSLLKTNRISYSEPGLMSVPKKLLWYLIKPFDSEDTLYSVDIKNQEPAILINILEDETLIEALKSKEGLYNTMYKKLMEPKAKMYILYDTFDTDGMKTVEECRENGMVSPMYFMPEGVHSSSWYYKNKKVVSIETKCQGAQKGKGIIKPDKVLIALEDKTAVEVKVHWENEVERISDGVLLNGRIEGLECILNKGERAEFKRAWLSITYGASSMGVAEACKLIDGNMVYKRIISLKAFKRYKDRCSKAAGQGIQTLSTYFGNMVSANKEERGQLKRSLLSIPIQGTGADLLALLIERFDNQTEERFSEYTEKPFIYYTRHDELIIEVPKQVMNTLGDEGVEEWLRDTLEHTVNNWVPFQVEVNKIEDRDIKELLEVED